MQNKPPPTRYECKQAIVDGQSFWQMHCHYFRSPRTDQPPQSLDFRDTHYGIEYCEPCVKAKYETKRFWFPGSHGQPWVETVEQVFDGKGFACSRCPHTVPAHSFFWVITCCHHSPEQTEPKKVSQCVLCPQCDGEVVPENAMLFRRDVPLHF